MFSRVIIATDLSPASMKIIRCAHGLLPIGTKEVLLLQCIKPMEALSLAFLESEEKMKSMLKEQKEILIEQGFKADTEVVFDSVHKAINRIACERNYSLILIGTHGETLSKDILLGSVASEMIQTTCKPLLVVRLGNSHGDKEEICILPKSCNDFYSSLLFPTDFSKNADEAFLYVEKIVESWCKSVTLLHVQDMINLEKYTKDEIRELDRIDMARLNNMKQQLLEINKDIEITLKLAHGKPSMEILKVSKSLKPSLIVMGSQGKGYVKELFVGSVSHTVTRHAKTSTLLIPQLRKNKGGE